MGFVVLEFRCMLFGVLCECRVGLADVGAIECKRSLNGLSCESLRGAERGRCLATGVLFSPGISTVCLVSVSSDVVSLAGNIALYIPPGGRP